MASSSDGIPVLSPMPDFAAHTSPFSSAGDMKFYLQNLLDNKEKQLQQAGSLGQRVLAQQMELEERIRQLQDLEADKSDEDGIDDHARERYRELADTLIAWDNENAQLSSVFGGSKRHLNGKTPSPSVPFAPLPREEPERPKPSAGTSAAQSRRAKNAAHRADDVEFAFEIGSGLLTEVRRLQSLLGERDKAIQDMKEEKDDLEKSVEALRAALKQQEQSSDKYKEENWNLEVTLQELRAQLSDSQFSIQRLENEHKLLADSLATSRETGDHYKNETDRLSTLVEEIKAKHETSIAQARRHAAGLAREKSDLQQTVDSLRSDIAKAGRRLPRFGSPLTPNGAVGSDFLHTPAGEHGEGDVFTGGASTNRRRLDTSAMFDGEPLDFADSPDVSPVRPPFLAANHPTNEMEAMQQRLAHAHRQINTLKGTLQREKQLRMEYRAKLQATSGGSDLADEIDEEVDEDDEDEGVQDGKRTKPRKVTPYKVGAGRGRGRGRGTTFTQRLGMAAASPSSEFNDDDGPHLGDSPAPPVPPIPIRFSQPEEDEDSLFSIHELQKDQPDEEEEQRPRSPSPMEPNSNRASVASVTSIEGMDPAFANILRRVPSNGSSYAGSPLRQVLGGSARGRVVGRRPRGGVPYKEVRPPSLVDAPGVLSAELLGFEGSPMKSQEILEEIEEPYHAPEMVEFGCQTEPTEPEAVVVSDTAEIAVQAVPESLPVPTSEHSIQTDEEPIPPPPVVPVLVETSVGTDPEPQPTPMPVLVAAQTQTIRVDTTDVDTQTNVTPSKPRMKDLGVGSSPTSADIRRTTITQYDRSFGSSAGDSTITRPFLAEDEESVVNDDDGDETETGADTETDTDDYQDARQSIMTPSGTESRDDFHSLMTMSDNEFSESEDDAESIKASRMSPSQQGQSSVALSDLEGSRRSSVYFAAASPPPPTYEDVGVSADFRPEPERIIVEVEVPAPVPPKPKVQEMSIQTDEWKPPVPPIPLVAPTPSPAFPPTPSSNPTLYRVGSGSGQQFQFIAPPTPGLPTSSAPTSPHTAAPIPVAAPGPLSSVLRESSGTFGRSRTPVTDRRQSMESVISSNADDLSKRSRVPSGATILTVVDKSKPPMMMLPPPPKLPPPPSSMPPPNFIPERRIPTGSSASYDTPPPRPSSPPPPELIQRATTPTFGSVLSVPGRGTLRQYGSMPPSQAGLRQPPSTSSFISAANAATHIQLSTPPAGTLSSLSVRERERRQFSQTSLISERSVASPRSSISSDHFRNPVTPEKSADITPRAAANYTTDPAVIHAITQTMIGEFLYKYTRRAIGKGHGQGRHKRFFWVHPYTRTLYWSSADPGSTNVSESSAKSAYIEGVRAVLDPNPMPPGLHQYSVIVSTPQREMKFTAPTKERHDIWLNALQYLLSRPSNMNITSPGNATIVPQSPVLQEYMDGDRLMQNASSPQSQRSFRSPRNGDTWNTTPRGQRSRSQVSVRGGSVGKRSGTPAVEYLRWNGPESPYSPTKSFVDVSHHDEEDLDFELHGEGMSDDGFEGLENVRACCDGKHTVGQPHHHHHHNGDHLEAVKKESIPARPVSPAWSFRSRTGSAHSTEGGGRGLFSWGKSDDQKRFGSRRSQKTVPVNE